MIEGSAHALVVGLAGPEPTVQESAWLVVHRPAGVILFARNVIDETQLAALCRRLHRLVPGLEIVADHEGGPVAQLAAAVGRPPAAWGLGVLDDADLTLEVCRETGRRLAAVGVDRVLAPVADVLTEPRNPVIAARAFGADPALCGRHVAAAVQGYLEGGVAVCLKHWPGHGGTDRDSHEQVAAIPVDPPSTGFEAGLAAGADAVMVGHLAGGAPHSCGLPATLDRERLVGLRLRSQASRSGPPCLYADDISMGALRPALAALGVPAPDGRAAGMVDPGDLTPAWLAAVAAGSCDRLLLRGIPWAALPIAASGPEAGRNHADTTPDPRPRRGFDERPYAAARARLWRLAGNGFVSPTATLWWEDLTPGDRWEPAGEDASTARMLSGPLVDLFKHVLRSPGVERPASGSCERLLVTSHRPLPPNWKLGADLATHGVALTMGHPALRPEIERRLGPHWRVGAVFDIRALELPPDALREDDSF